MHHDEVDQLLQQAEELFQAAEREKERSEEDVVTHLLCVNSRQSLVNYLAVFLMRRNIPLGQPVTVDGLHRQCCEVDARFEALDLSPVHCRCQTHDNDYCLDLGQVQQCMDAARQARAIVTQQVPGY
ncbi:MAG: hypothetical protein R3330_00125 [Saprospiraceae bacterium]|nr:hypothetical protein [Saprospiraceae bacterium]